MAAKRRSKRQFKIFPETQETHQQESEHAYSDSEFEPQETHQQESEQASDSDSDLRLKPNGKRPRPAVDKVRRSKRSKKSKGAEKVSKDQDSMSDSEPHPHQQESQDSSDSDSDSKAKTDKSKSVKKADKGSKTNKRVEDVNKGKSKMSIGDKEGGENEDKKVSVIARVYSEGDEIVLLQGMLDFKENNGTDPSLNVVAFHKSVEDLLSCRVTKRQLSEKMRKLKIKFVKKVEKGKDPDISNPHEYKSFELSKKIWGSEVYGRNKMPMKSNWWSSYPFLCASLESEAIKNFTAPLSPNKYVNKVLTGLKEEKARELEKEWESFSAMEHQVYVRRLEVISKQAEAIMKVNVKRGNWKI